MKLKGNLSLFWTLINSLVQFGCFSFTRSAVAVGLHIYSVCRICITGQKSLLREDSLLSADPLQQNGEHCGDDSSKVFHMMEDETLTEIQLSI